ncbi:MAG TPA: hypothetical protein VLB80_02525 [Candidatus Babeliales bacterium]|nr:hypothetical protein [Candidatus Babeliales bacterium]
MKKYILIVVIGLSFVSQARAMDYFTQLKQYFFGKPVEKLPLVTALEEFNVAGREFLPELSSGKPSSKDLLSIKLFNRCSDINNDKIENPSVKDIEILKFAQNMAMHEKEWKDWHVKNLRSESSKKKEKHFCEIDLNINGKIRKVRIDEQSPYFELCTTGNRNVTSCNFIENESFHDELKFLQMQLHKMELYWNIKPDEEKKLQQDDFNKMHQVLQQEIELLKNNRKAFTRSCLKTKTFENLQSARNKYIKDTRTNLLSWRNDIMGYGNSKKFNCKLSKKLKRECCTIKERSEKYARNRD